MGQTKGDLNIFYSVVEEAEERSLNAYLNAAKGESAITAFMSKGMDLKLLRIGELAEAARETKATIRFWTKEGLLEVAKITESGYAFYDAKMIEKVKEIRHLQNEERLSISEIKKLLKS